MLMMAFVAFMILADAKFCLNKISNEDIALFVILLIIMTMSSGLDILVYNLMR